MIERVSRARRVRTVRRRLIARAPLGTLAPTSQRHGARRAPRGSLLAGALAVLLLLAWTQAGQPMSSESSMTAQVMLAATEWPSFGPTNVMAEELDDNTDGALQDADRAAWQTDGSADLAPWYQLAAAEYGVSAHLLRALHQVESNAALDGCTPNLQGSGALGPFQFKRATFSQYGVDGDNDGTRDICSFADSLFSAARYLSALGLDDLDGAATRNSLARYGTDPGRVMVLALHYRDRSARTP